MSAEKKGADVDVSNLTGGQVQEVLDHLMYRAVEPIVLHSTVFDAQVAHLLSVAATNKKRKLSALPREEFLNKACFALLCDDREAKYEAIRTSKIERGFVYNFVVEFLKHVGDYAKLYEQYLIRPDRHLDMRLRAIENGVGFPREHLLPAINTCTRYLDKTYEFRNVVMNNYLRHAYKQAMAFCSQRGENFDFWDVYQNLVVAVAKAIGKYDSASGALTSYVNYWLLNAQTYASAEHGHEYGIAYSIPQSTRKSMAQNSGSVADVNFSVSLDELLAEDLTLGDLLTDGKTVDGSKQDEQENEKMLMLIKKADRDGLARLYLDISEVFTVNELRRMDETTLSKKGN